LAGWMWPWYTVKKAPHFETVPGDGGRNRL
jgi:hypothetical protein